MKKSRTEASWDLLRQRVTGWSDSVDEDLCEFGIAAEFHDLADGTTVGECQELFYVTVYYREPATPYEFDPTVRSWSHEVSAPDASRAQALALKDFRTIEGLSSTRWRREIVSVSVLASSDSQ